MFDDNISSPRQSEARASATIFVDEEDANDDLSAKPPGDIIAPVLDKNQLSSFVALMGADWVANALREFALAVEGGMASLATATPAELAAITHGMIMMASHCGFAELATLCAELQYEARQGAGLDRAPELRAAADRALAVMRSDSPLL